MHASAYTGAGRISIHAAREGGDATKDLPELRVLISIHAAREGGDVQIKRYMFGKTISIHAAREGGDENGGLSHRRDLIFQSTPPVKAATQLYFDEWHCPSFQSTPPVKAATPSAENCNFLPVISIHAAREGGDQYGLTEHAAENISIHAAREGGDL